MLRLSLRAVGFGIGSSRMRVGKEVGTETTAKEDKDNIEQITIFYSLNHYS